MSAVDDLLTQGIAAAKAGQRQEARRCLQAVLRDNPRHEQAWIWLSGVLDVPAQRRECLQRVLTINPDNEQARLGLQQLAEQEAADFLAVFEPRKAPASAGIPQSTAASAMAHAPVAVPEAENQHHSAPDQSSAVAAAEPDAAVSAAALPALGAIAPPPTDISGPLAVPLQVGSKAPPVGVISQVEVSHIAHQAPAPAMMPPLTPQIEAPCYFCKAMTGASGQCGACGMEQIFDCPECGRAIDLRERTLCECGEFSMQRYLGPAGVNREAFGDLYRIRDYPGAAVKQWKAALATSAHPNVLHRKIAEVYLDLGLVEQARMHHDLSKQR